MDQKYFNSSFPQAIAQAIPILFFCAGDVSSNCQDLIQRFCLTIKELESKEVPYLNQSCSRYKIKPPPSIRVHPLLASSFEEFKSYVQIIQDHRYSLALNYFCSVKITFKDSGINQFLGQNYKFKPDYVWVNEHQIEYQESIEGKYTILLNENEYTIKVGWNDPPTSCSNMFNGIQGIIAIDLSEFDSSKVVDMSNDDKNVHSLNILDISTTFNVLNLLSSIDSKLGIL